MWIAYVATKGSEGSDWRPMVLHSQVGDSALTDCRQSGQSLTSPINAPFLLLFQIVFSYFDLFKVRSS